MTVMSMIDYGLIVLFFIGLIGLLWLTILSQPQEGVPPPELPLQEARTTYIFMIALFVLLFVLAFFVQRSQSHAHV